MAKITEGLFGVSIEQLQAENDAQRRRLYERLDSLQGYNKLGGAIGTVAGELLGAGITKLFNLKDPKMEKATNIRQAIMDVSQEFPNDTLAQMDMLAQRFGEMGYGDEALVASAKAEELFNTERNYALKREELDYNKAALQSKANEAAITKATNIAKQNLADQERYQEKIQKNIEDKEGFYWQAAQGWAAGLENNVEGFFDVDEEALANGLLQLQTELLGLTVTDENGIRNPMFSPSQAFQLAKDYLGEVDEKSSTDPSRQTLKNYKKKWYGWTGSVGLPADAREGILNYLIEKNYPTPDQNTKSQMPSNLTTEQQEAYLWAEAHPDDPRSKTILDSLPKPDVVDKPSIKKNYNPNNAGYGETVTNSMM